MFVQILLTVKLPVNTLCRCRRHAVTPFCDTVRASPLQLTCRQDQLAVAVCNLQKHAEELPPEYQVHKGRGYYHANVQMGGIYQQLTLACIRIKNTISG